MLSAGPGPGSVDTGPGQWSIDAECNSAARQEVDKLETFHKS